jgi:uncharacterized membrane protein
MTSTFIGGATGSAFGLFLWNIGHWPAVCAGCSGVVLVNIFLFFRNKARAARNTELAVQKA